MSRLTESDKARYNALTPENVEFFMTRYNKVNRWVIACPPLNPGSNESKIVKPLKGTRARIQLNRVIESRNLSEEIP